MSNRFDDSYFNVLRLLLEHNVNVDAQDNKHSTPLRLYLASIYGSVKAVRILLQHGANINVRKRQDPVPGCVRKRTSGDQRLLSEYVQSEC